MLMHTPYQVHISPAGDSIAFVWVAAGFITPLLVANITRARS